MMTPGEDRSGGTAVWLGWAGVLPFVALAVAGWLPGVPIWTDGAFVAYSALILSFLGGIRWGRAMTHGASTQEYLRSVMPSLLAWPTLMLPLDTAVPALALGFVLVAINDSRGETMPAPPWFARLRVGLTLVVVLCHGAVWMALRPSG
jgi:hypothetical protein